MLKKDTNYIVSGLERSGTSLMMQLLEAGGLPVAYDSSRKSDEFNPKGYFELDGGKVIPKLQDGTFELKKYRGKFIKITSWGLKSLPEDGKYEIIYMMRNIDEIVESTIKMAGKEYNREELHNCLVKFENSILEWMKEKESSKFRFIPMFYNAFMTDTAVKSELSILSTRYYPEFDAEKAIRVIDKKLYRNRHG